MSGLVKMEQIQELFGREATNQIRKGKNLMESHHIVRVHYDADYKHLYGTVQASQKKSVTYTPSVFLNGKSIGEVTCSCLRGQKHCGHIAALLVHAKDNISCTDVSCCWIRPKAPYDGETQSIDALFPRKKPYSCGVEVAAADWEKFHDQLKNCGDAAFGVRFLLGPEPERPASKVTLPNVKGAILSEEFSTSTNKVGFLEDRLHLTRELIQEIELATRGQVSNPLWTLAREFCFTASKFGPILDACSKASSPPSLLKSLLEGFDGSKVHATKWGIDNEPVAIKLFTDLYGLEVTPSRFWYHPCGYLGGSPDNFVGYQCIIQVKCPYKYRKDKLEVVLQVESLEELYNKRTMTLKKGTYAIAYHEDTWFVNEFHPFYHQIQGCLHFANREMCYLVVWTPQSCACVKVFRDEKWLENIPILQTFYGSLCSVHKKSIVKSVERRVAFNGAMSLLKDWLQAAVGSPKKERNEKKEKNGLWACLP